MDGTLTRLRGGSGGEGAATYAASRDLEVVEGTEVAPGNRLLAGD